jgi:calpain-15
MDGAPCFSSANGNELWVIILEKAWAKVHGSYERIEAGLAHEVMRDLTGAPSYDEDVDDEGLFEKLETYDKKHYMMAASAGSTDASAEVLEELGLVAAHSYGLLSAKRITDQNGE